GRTTGEVKGPSRTLGESAPERTLGNLDRPQAVSLGARAACTRGVSSSYRTSSLRKAFWPAEAVTAALRGMGGHRGAPHSTESRSALTNLGDLTNLEAVPIAVGSGQQGRPLAVATEVPRLEAF